MNSPKNMNHTLDGRFMFFCAKLCLIIVTFDKKLIKFIKSYVENNIYVIYNGHK